MEWKRYVQHNSFGPGDTYTWAYDEAVCAVGGTTPSGNPDYPWCTTTDASKGAVDSEGSVTDSSCPCTVFNSIAPLGMMPFAENGYGTHMHLHVYNVMSPAYVPPTEPADFKAITLDSVEAEQD